MPAVDISEEDIALLEAARKAGGIQGLDLAVRARALHDKLYSHKDTSRDYQASIKKVFPDAPTDMDRAAPFVEPLDGRLKELEEWRASRLQADADAVKNRRQADFDSSWAQTVKDHSLTAEGEEKLLNYMRDQQQGDPEAAALKYFKHNPPPPAPITPSSISPSGWARDMGLRGDADDTDLKLLHSNPNAWEDKEAAAVLNDVRSQAA